MCLRHIRAPTGLVVHRLLLLGLWAPLLPLQLLPLLLPLVLTSCRIV